jgi:hypothetical protein
MQDCHSRSEALGSQLDTIERKVGGLYKRHEALVAKLDGLPSVTVNGVPE